MRPMGNIDAQTPTAIQRHAEQTDKVLRSNISFGDTMGNTDRSQNMDCWKATGTTPGVANTEFSFVHGLGRIPITIVGQDTNNGGLLYRGATAWTATTVFLRCTTATALFNIIVI